MTAQRLTTTNRNRLAAAAALVAALAALLVPGAGPAAVKAPGGDRYTPAVMSVMSPPQWFKGTDGKYSLVYELELTNGFATPIGVTTVTIRNGRQVPLARLSGSRLRRSMSPLANPQMATRDIPGSGVAVVWVELRFDRKREIPGRIEHVVTVRPDPSLPVPRSITSVGGRASVDRRDPVAIGPPLVGANWVAVGSCCDGPHRRALQPVNGRLRLGQRFAVDWNGMDSADRFVVGDPDTNAAWTFYGKPVVAVASGVVVAAADRFPEQIPNHPVPVTLPEADGNHVILRIGPGRYVGYAHLARGTVAVKRGQRVAAGDLIGALGNSGSSSGPHLHFQVMDAPSMVDSNGLPFVIDSFDLVGRIPPLTESLAARLARGLPAPIASAGAGPRRGELPLGRDVVDFP